MYWRRRIYRHLQLALASCSIYVAIYWVLESPNAMFKMSMASAYAALALLAVCLMIGPCNVIRGRPNPISTDLRRDIGIWAALIGVVHTVVGLQVHSPGKFWLYFVFPAEERRVIPIRYDLIGVSNYSGLAATVLLLTLLALSNDFALRKLGLPRWKSIQRWNYLLFLLVAVHGAVYQWLEKRELAIVGILALLLSATGLVQFAGYRKRTTEYAQSKSQSEVPLTPTEKQQS